MNEIRQSRVSDEIKRILAESIQTELKDPGIPPMTSVTGVKVSSDLSFADCFISVMGTADEKEAAIRALKRAKGFLKRQIALNMRIRQMPELRFILDNTEEEAERIDELIRQAFKK